MNSCMISHATAATEDAAREEWFANVQERRRKKETEALAVEERRKEVIDMIKRQEEKERAQIAAQTKNQMGEDPQNSEKKGWWR
jgi:hypothetical protein